MRQYTKLSFLIDYIGLGALSLAILAVLGVEKSSLASFLIGHLLFSLNLFLLSAAWRMIIAKKLVALAISIIVIKYALLVMALYYFLNKEWMNPLYLIASGAMTGLAVVTYTMRKNGI